MADVTTTGTDFLRGEWRSMQQRLVEHLREPRSSDLSAEAVTLDAGVYTDPDRFEAEREHLFREQPLLVGFSGDLPEPGDRLVFDAAGPPIVVVRGKDRGLRAFQNLCPHRGSRLVESCERSRRLTCPFHAWSFDLDGKLVSFPHPAAFEGLDRDAHGLVRVPVEEWSGMIFARTTPGEALDVETFLGPIGPLMRALDLGSLERVKLDRIPVSTNWKLALDTFCETYHVPALHKDSLATHLFPYVTIFDHYGRHHRYSGPGLDFGDFTDRPESEWPSGGYQAVHYLFPNTTIAFTHAFDGETPVVSMFQLFPGESVGQTITLGSTYRRSDADATTDEEIAEMHAMVLDIVCNEDYRVAREGWASLVNAPPGFRLVLGRTEALLQRYHRDIADAIGRKLPA
jgi:phenylpropionate dioxygenase-like ring-hydroxylating dioxygenase large terminal subunit